MEKQLDAAALIADGPEAEELRKLLQKEQAAKEKAEREAMCRKETEDYEYRVKAVVETALAYWRRGAALQYDSIDLVDAPSRYGGIGSRRATDNISPEDATLDQPKYTVCSTLPYNLYTEVIGIFAGMGANECACTHHYKLADQSIVYHWKENHGETVEDMVNALKLLLRPGDILTSAKKTQHAIIYLGDCLGDGNNYFLHSWGAKYNMKTGKDSYETQGTMRLQTGEQLVFVKGQIESYRQHKLPRWSMYDGIKEVVILRPLRIYKAEEYPLSSNAVARLAHPGLDIDRRASLTPYETLPRGGQVTYTVTVKNHSKTDYDDVTVFEKIPEGTQLVSAPGAVAEPDGLHWTLKIGAGDTAKAVFTVRHTGSSDYVVAEGGNVAGIRSNCIRTQVGNVPAPELLEKLTGHATITDAWKEVGVELDLDRVFDTLTEPVPDFEGLFRVKENHGLPVIPRYYGGRKLVTYSSDKRILEFDLRYLMTGDVLVYLKDGVQTRYLYMGGGKFFLETKNGLERVENDVIWPALTYDLFVALRPGLLL